ncbi:MAG: alkaline phosphatase family protein [Ruminococcaceae bacterium]|nr:alkaline phosphatase family protein [Oscillospiraceae bacterium]
MFTMFQSAIAAVITFFMMLYGMIAGINFGDTVKKYKENVSSVESYSNTLETAIPQTDIYAMIKNHFEAELPAGKTEKKVIVLGFDGGRADALSLLDGAVENSAISYLLSTDGTAQIGYCGGVNYPKFHKQDTSTAPGWAAILTGQWADVTGVKGNGVPKSNDHLSLLTSLVEDKIIADSAFYVSWNGHFVDDDSTYVNEKQYIADKNLDVTFSDADDDDGTFANTLADVQNADCSDFIFTIFEYPDHNGHDTGFCIENPDYADAFRENDAQCKLIIDAIESRDTYETEDWLIILTSDHGGYNTGHGFLTIQERMTFIVAR